MRRREWVRLNCGLSHNYVDITNYPFMLSTNELIYLSNEI